MEEAEIKRAVDKIRNAAAKQDGAFALQVGGAFDRMLGRAFDAERFVKAGGKFEINIIPFDAEVTLAATTAFADGTFTLSNDADTFRLVLGVGILHHDDGAGITDGPMDQLNSAGRLEIVRSRGAVRTWAYWAVNLGAGAPGHQDGITTLVRCADAEPFAPWAKLIPAGLAAALAMPLDALATPNDTFKMKFTGLNGVTLDDSHSGLKANAVALVIDVVQDGR